MPCLIYYGGNDMNKKEFYSTPGMLELMLIMQNTMREEFIIVKHDIQHLKFISGNTGQEGFKEIQEYAETLENLVLKLQKTFIRFLLHILKTKIKINQDKTKN